MKKSQKILAIGVAVLTVVLVAIFSLKPNKEDLNLTQLLSNLSKSQYTILNLEENDNEIVANFKFKEPIQVSEINDITQELEVISKEKVKKPIKINLIVKETIDTSKFYDNQIGDIEIGNESIYTYYSEFKDEKMADKLSKYDNKNVEFKDKTAKVNISLNSEISEKQFYKEALLYLDVLKNANTKEISELQLILQNNTTILEFNSNYQVIKTTKTL